MSEMTPGEVDAALFGPRTIYAPDGTTFVAKCKYDPSTMKQALKERGWTSYEVRGPGEDGRFFWIMNADGVCLPDVDDVPPTHLTITATVALQAWLRLCEELGDLAQ